MVFAGRQIMATKLFVAQAVPIVSVSHPLAKVTHEAAIGSVDKRQMEALMAHGLSPEGAVDVIVKGILI